MEWIPQPIYAPGAKTAHSLKLRPNHKRVVDKNLETSIEEEIKGLIMNPKLLTQDSWIKRPQTDGAIDGVAIFQGVHCPQCKKSAPANPGDRKCHRICKCKKPLEPSTVQSVAYHWAGCLEWFQVPAPLEKYPSATDPVTETVDQLRSWKIQLLAGYITAQAPLPNPVLLRLGLNAFCQIMWGHPTFSAMWEGIKQWPQAKVELQLLVFKTVVEDYNQLITSNPTFKQLVFSNRRYVSILPISDGLNLISLSLSLPAHLGQP